MNARARVCGVCGVLNGADERKCYRCGASLGPWARALRDVWKRPFIATQILVGLCLIDFIGMTLAGGEMPPILGLGSGLTPLVQAGGIVGNLLALEPWRYLSAVYVHLGLLHLGMNMLALVNLGRPTEDYLGAARFVLLFTLTGVLGFVASRVWYGEISPPTAGASGALFGLIGHYIGVLQARKDPRARQLLLEQLAYAVAFALVFPMNNAAHFGGFITGYGAAWLLRADRRPHKTELAARALAVLCLLAAVASMVLSARSPVIEEVRARDAAARH